MTLWGKPGTNVVQHARESFPGRSVVRPRSPARRRLQEDARQTQRQVDGCFTRRRGRALGRRWLADALEVARQHMVARGGAMTKSWPSCLVTLTQSSSSPSEIGTSARALVSHACHGASQDAPKQDDGGNGESSHRSKGSGDRNASLAICPGRAPEMPLATRIDFAH